MSRETLGTQPLQELLGDVQKGNLAPGGISMAALMGGVAAALVGFVARLTLGRPGYEPLTEEMERVGERAGVLEEQLLALMDQEVEAFNQLAGSAALPKGTPEDAGIRRDCMRLAMRGYTQVPLQIGALGMEVLQLTETAVRYGNREVIADGGTAFLAAVAAVKATAIHVLLNLRGQDDEEWVAPAREKIQKWLESLPALESEIWARVMQDVSQE